jgi:hypothetical protein
MNTQTFDPETISQIVQEWQTTLAQLMKDVSEWIQDQPGWSIQPISQKQISEETLGTYTAPVLTIDTPQGRLILEPIARMVFGGRSTVEMYAWPTLYRVRLIRKAEEDDWIILTDSGIPLRQPWNRETFLTLAQDLLGAE